MDKSSQLESKVVFLLDVLVAQADGHFMKKKDVAREENIIGICVGDKAWCLSRVPTFPHEPEKFLNLVRELGGVPFEYPKKEDFLALKKNFEAVEDTFGKIMGLNSGKNRVLCSHFVPFSRKEAVSTENYLKRIEQNGNIRFVLALDKIL